MSLLFDVDGLQTQHNNALSSRRFGRLILSRSLLESAPEAVQKLYGKVVPTAVKYDFAREIFEITALSEEFDSVEESHQIPFYHITIRCHKRVKGTGKAYYFDFTKIEVE